MQVELFHCCFMRKYRPIRVDGDLAYITLTKGYEAVIDAVDVHLVDGFNWSAITPRPGGVYARRNNLTACGKRTAVYMHREILGHPAGFDVDHIDGNGLNNKRENLRIATVSQNAYNSLTPKNNTSGYKGATFHNRFGRWIAKISAEGKSHHLGYFDTPEEAHAAYCEASKRLHGEFAKHK